MYRFLKKVLIVFCLCLLCSLGMVSCKSKKAVVENQPTENTLKPKKIIEKHYNNKTDFSTLYIKSKVSFENDKTTQNVIAEIKIKKDEQILVSIKVLGFIVAKAMITPASVSYYEKMGGTYYEGDFSKLSQMLGTDLDFTKVQNLLLGQALDDLKKGKYTESITDGIYRLDDEDSSDLKKTFYIDSSHFFLQKQEITQTTENRMIQVVYSNQKDYSGFILPLFISINAFQKGAKTEIKLEIDSINLNEELSFPYSIPNGYKKKNN